MPRYCPLEFHAAMICRRFRHYAAPLDIRCCCFCMADAVDAFHAYPGAAAGTLPLFDTLFHAAIFRRRCCHAAMPILSLFSPICHADVAMLLTLCHAI